MYDVFYILVLLYIVMLEKYASTLIVQIAQAVFPLHRVGVH